MASSTRLFTVVVGLPTPPVTVALVCAASNCTVIA